VVAGVAAGAALPHGQLVDAGYKGGIYHTHGSASGAFIQIGAKKVEGAFVVGPLLLVLDEIADSNATKKVALEFVTAYEKQFASRPPIFGAGVYDAGLLLSRAIPEAAKKATAGHARVPRRPARCAGGHQGHDHVPGCGQHDGAGPLRLRPAGYRADDRQGRQVRPGQGLTDMAAARPDSTFSPSSPAGADHAAGASPARRTANDPLASQFFPLQNVVVHHHAQFPTCTLTPGCRALRSAMDRPCEDRAKTRSTARRGQQ
jgi:hypothetical protein